MAFTFSIPWRPTSSQIVLLYALFATLWIVVSAVLLTSTVSDLTLQNRIALADGVLFVAVTSWLLWREQRRIKNLITQTQKMDAEVKLQQAHTALQESLERTQALVDAALDAVISMDQEGRVIAWNPRAEVIFGYSKEQAIGREVAELIVPPAQRETHRRGLARFLTMGSTTFIGRCVELRGMRADGSEFPMELTVLALTQNGKQFFSAYGRDITERKKAEETINNLAFYDPLTQLPNRRLLLDRLQQTLHSSSRNHRFGAVLCIDLDDFKSLNDTKGQDIGDLLLIEIGRQLQAAVHPDDTVARIGSDEFVVVLDALGEEPDQAAAKARTVAERALAAINLPRTLQAHEYHCSASIGITLFRDHEATVDEVLRHADVGMNQAKNTGRNTIRFFDPVTQAALDARVLLESWMQKALPAEFRLYYQMQVDHTGHIFGAEALIRWQHPEKGIIEPAAFIPLAEESGLILPIGQWVLETACTQLKSWETDPFTSHLVLAINVSAKQFHQPDFVDQVIAVLHRTGADPNKLKLELTESMLVNDVEEIIYKVGVLGAHGVKLSLDDFGTGFSSLAYLKYMSLHQLKIDQSFVRNALADTNDAAIIRTVIALGKSLGMEVIAEGVETEEHRGFLAAHGCNHYQGFLFSHPVPLQEFEKLLHQDPQLASRYAASQPEGHS